MAGQIETNEQITKIKEKNAELTTAAAEGKGKLADATSKVTELKTEMSTLIPEIPTTPSIQGELSKLGSLDAGGLVSKISALVSQYGSAIPGLNDLLGTMGLSSYPPTIDVSSIRAQIPNVEVIDGATVVQPQESNMPEEAPAAPIEKADTDIDWKEISLSLLREQHTTNKLKMLAVVKTHRRRTRSAVQYVYMFTFWESLAAQVGSTIEGLSEYVNTGNKEKSDRYTALYTVADSNMVFNGVKSGYIKVKGEHKESDDLLDFADTCNYWWEKKQKNA